MKKNVKVLSGALAASLTMGAMPVFAADMSADELYKAAFEAVLAAQEARTQESINAARTAIKALAGTDAEFAVGEFSKQVDGVQQELFEGFLAALDKAQESNKQADINAARTYVEMFRTCPDTLVYVEGGWSQEVDLVQQKLIDKAEAAVRKAQETKLQADVDAAKALLEELATSTNKDVTAWVTIIETELEAVKVIDLEVTKVNAIETTIVEVAFDALTEAKAGVTIEVKDSEGVVREVVAQDLAKGATFAQFDFATVVKADDLKGVWTVNGQAYSFTELKLVQDIVTEATANNQVKLFSLLTEAGIKNLNADYIVDYATDIKDATTTPVWASDVQKIIDNTNKNKAEAKDEATVVKAVVDATTQIQLKAALEANFERVNADWIAEYATEDIAVVTGTNMLDLVGPANYFGVNVTGVNMNDIQAAIDNANASAIATANGNADTSAKQAAVTALIQNWVKADDPETPLVTDKADAIKQSQIKEAAFRVAEATTENSLYNALVAYANITPDATLKASELNANLKAYYKNALDTKTKAALVLEIKDGTENIKGDFVTAVDDAALEDVVVDLGAAATTLKTTDNSTNRAAFKAELVRLANFTSHKDTATTKFLMSTIDETLLVEYATQMDADVIGTGKLVSDVQGSVKTVNDASDVIAQLKAINEAKTAQEVKVVLDELAIAKYVNVPSVDKLHIAEQVLELRNTLTAGRDALAADGNASGNTTTEAKKFVNLDEVEGNLVKATDGVIVKYNTLVSEFAYAKLTDTATTVTQLGKLGYDAFDNLTASKKAVVAEAFKASYPVDKEGATVDFTTLNAVKVAIDAAIAK